MYDNVVCDSLKDAATKLNANFRDKKYHNLTSDETSTTAQPVKAIYYDGMAHCETGLIAWDPHLQKDISQLEVQRRAARLCCGEPVTTQTEHQDVLITC